jgi:predicted nuclease of restriction endonuclease-like (RecB) superfamily
MEQIVRADYVQAVKAIKQAIQVTRYRVSRHANGESLGLYYAVGKYISEHSRNAVWGTGAIEQISNQLQQEMPGLIGFSAESMRKMRLFYEAWADVFENRSAVSNDLGIMPISAEIQPFIFCSTVLNELGEQDLSNFISLGFTLHYNILSKTKDLSARWFYIRKAATEFWGYRRLEQALRDDLYHTLGAMPSNFELTIPNEKQRAVAMQTFKENHVLDFWHVDDPDHVDERDVEQHIVNNIKNFMMSLGNEFTFMGNQYRVIVDEKERFIDLLFYHRRMRCMVAIELKNGEFQPEYAGKLNFYLSALDEYVKLPDENPSIGIILCRDKSNTEVEFTLRDMSKPLGVATYRSVDELPEHYRALPSADELRKLM